MQIIAIYIACILTLIYVKKVIHDVLAAIQLWIHQHVRYLVSFPMLPLSIQTFVIQVRVIRQHVPICTCLIMLLILSLWIVAHIHRDYIRVLIFEERSLILISNCAYMGSLGWYIGIDIAGMVECLASGFIISQEQWGSFHLTTDLFYTCSHTAHLFDQYRW